MKIKEYLKEAKPDTNGRERLVSSILNMMQGKKPSRLEIKMYLSRLDKDKAFMNRIKSKAAKLGKDGYIWASIRARAAQHFSH